MYIFSSLVGSNSHLTEAMVISSAIKGGVSEIGRWSTHARPWDMNGISSKDPWISMRAYLPRRYIVLECSKALRVISQGASSYVYTPHHILLPHMLLPLHVGVPNQKITIETLEVWYEYPSYIRGATMEHRSRTSNLATEIPERTCNS